MHFRLIKVLAKTIYIFEVEFYILQNIFIVKIRKELSIAKYMTVIDCNYCIQPKCEHLCDQTSVTWYVILVARWTRNLLS